MRSVTGSSMSRWRRALNAASGHFILPAPEPDVFPLASMRGPAAAGMLRYGTGPALWWCSEFDNRPTAQSDRKRRVARAAPSIPSAAEVHKRCVA